MSAGKTLGTDRDAGDHGIANRSTETAQDNAGLRNVSVALSHNPGGGHVIEPGDLIPYRAVSGDARHVAVEPDIGVLVAAVEDRISHSQETK